MPKHTHKYHRINKARPPKEYWVMACALNCTHYIAMATKISAPELVGKLSICNKCSSEFELTRRALKMAKPICDDCVGSKEKKEIEKAKDFFEDLEKGLVK